MIENTLERFSEKEPHIVSVFIGNKKSTSHCKNVEHHGGLNPRPMMLSLIFEHETDKTQTPKS